MVVLSVFLPKLFFVTFFLSVFLLSASLLLMFVKIFFNRSLYEKLIYNSLRDRGGLVFSKVGFIFRFIFVVMVFLIFGGFLLGILFWLKLYIVILLVVLYFIFLMFLVWRLNEEDIESFEFGLGIYHAKPIHIYMRFKNKFVEKIVYKCPAIFFIVDFLFWIGVAVIALLLKYLF